MHKLLVFLAIFHFLSGPLLIIAQELLASDWLLASDFKPADIANLTVAEQNRLLLKRLAVERPRLKWTINSLEVFARFVGIEFCGIVEDEDQNRLSTAILRATFESMTKLQFQDRVARALDFGFTNNLMPPNESSDIGVAFARICATIDARLNNETSYTQLRDEYAKKDTWQPKKAYLYGIPKSEDDFRKALTEFANAPPLKKLWSHFVFIAYYYSAEQKWPAKRYMKRLAALPGKTEAVQQIYDEAMQELSGEIGDVSADQVELENSLGRNLSQYAPNLYEKLKEKIYANADWKSRVEEWQKQSPQTG